MNLLRLQEFTTNDDYRKRAEKTFKAFSQTLKQNPIALSEMLLALDFYLDKPFEIVIVKASSDAEKTFLPIMRKTFLPNKIIAIVEKGDQLKRQSKLIPLMDGKVIFENKTTAYVCRAGVCKFPTTEPKKFKEQISGVNTLLKIN